MGVQGCTAPLYFEMDCNTTPNFVDFINNVPQMGVQSQIPIKSMYPRFQIPNAPSETMSILTRFVRIPLIFYM